MEWNDPTEQAALPSAEVRDLVAEKVPTRYREMAKRNHREMGIPLGAGPRFGRAGTHRASRRVVHGDRREGLGRAALAG